MMTYAFLSQMTKYMLSDFTVTIVTLLTFMLWLCSGFEYASLINASDRLQNRGHTLAFFATYVAAVVAQNFLFHVSQ